MKISEQGSVKISKDMYGLFFEDINYSLDGGLYAQMLENRNFEAEFATGRRDAYTVVYDGSYGWSLYEDAGAGSAISMGAAEPLNHVNPHYLFFEGKGEKPSFKNKAYDGIYAEQGKKYFVSFYARPVEGSREVTISICRHGEVVAEAVISVDEDGWKQYSAVLIPSNDVKQADFVVSLGGEGKMMFDYFSMMPEDAVLGIFRKDLAEKLKALKPSFLRFPGGCIVEGNMLSNRYRWKDTIAPVEERKFNWNRWAVHGVSEETGFSGSYAHYGQTYGVGYYEYFLLCEYLGAKALPVMNVGLACQFMSSEKVDIESEEMREYIADALDLIEFANGSADSFWGRKRAKMGHEEPFGLEYLGIGNEQWQTKDINFFARYEMFEQAIHEKYPEIKLIGSAGADVWGDGYFQAWEWAKKKVMANGNMMYAMDEHYYVSPDWLLDHVHFYDTYDRQIKVFAGEYACHIPGVAGKFNCPKANTLECALAEAAFMTGLEKNADVVVLASYAPLFARMGYTQWSPNLIWFDGEKSYETPSYFVQQLFSRYRGTSTLHVDMECDVETERKNGIFASAVRDDEGRVILKIVNMNNDEREVTLCAEPGIFSDGTKYQVKYICGDKEDGNSIYDREKVAVREETGKMIDGKLQLKGNSFMTFVLEGKR